MCGIAGIIGRDPDCVRDAVERMTATMAHRGPDAEGVEVHAFGDSWLGLGHRRLSIIDLSPLGRQPMGYPTSGGRIVYNGEIYNYQTLRRELQSAGDVFRSGSDTEVVLAGIARYGPSFVERLEGMYAFALFDPREPSLLLARDPAGIKPLYVAKIEGGFAFASEVRAILACGLVRREVSRAAVAGLLAHGSVPQPLTIFDSIRMSPPGAWQLVRPAPGGGCRLEPRRVWWRPPEPQPVPEYAEVVLRTRQRLDEAVRDHLIADVPVGVFLSAGLDSAAVAGLAARHSKDVRAFTVAVSDQPDFDELSVAAETARRFGLPHVPIQVPSAEAEQAAREWLAAADQPSLDGLNTFIISKAVRAHGATVALCGLGADELFGGYETFRDLPRLRRLRRAVGWLPARARRSLAGALAARKPPAYRDKLVDLLGGPADVGGLVLSRRRVLSNRQLAALGINWESAGLSSHYLPPEAAAELPAPGADPGWAASITESRFYQTNTLLRDSDANGMAHGLEIRVPYLDQRLLNMVHALPGSIRFPRGGPPKALLRAAAGDVLHPDLLARRKTGFTLPLRRWMAGPLRPLCVENLTALKASGLVNPEGVDAVWIQFESAPEGTAWSRTFILVALGDFLRRHAA